jgi:hypothetical protein
MIGHMVPNFGPNGEKGALSFVVTGIVLVRGAKVSGHDWAVNGRHNFPQG